MTPDEQKHLAIGLLLGGVVVYFLSQNKKYNTAGIWPFSHADRAVSDYGNNVIVANNGKLNTVVGLRSPIELTYTDFNQLIADPNNVLKDLPESEVINEHFRAANYLNEIGWLTLFENYSNMLPQKKVKDMIIFALNLGSGFRLLPSNNSASTTTPFTAVPANVTTVTTTA